MQNKIEVDSELLNSGISLIFKSMVIMIAPVILGLFIYSRYIYTEKDSVLENEFNGRLEKIPKHAAGGGRGGIIIEYKTLKLPKTTKKFFFVIKHKDKFKYYVVTQYLNSRTFNNKICYYAEVGDSIYAIKNQPTFKIIKKDTVLILNKYEYENRK